MAEAFAIRRTDGGQPLHWAADPTLYADESLDRLTGGVRESLALVESAAARWEAVDGAGLLLDASRSVGAVPGYDLAAGGENRSEVIAVDSLPGETPEALAVTLVTYDTVTGRVLDADVLVQRRGNRLCLGAEPHRYDLDSVVTHEIGHALGLAHSLDAEATMFAETPVDSTEKRTLSQDDEAGLLAIYGPEGELASRAPGAGCRSAPGSRIASPLALFFVLGVLFRRRSARILAAAALFVALLPVGEVRAIDVASAAFEPDAAARISLAEGRVLGVTSTWTGRWVETAARIETPDGVATVRWIGGEAGRLGTWVVNESSIGE